jgi:5-methyltetrahydrofolate--homocysteine methyltransferase
MNIVTQNDLRSYLRKSNPMNNLLPEIKTAIIDGYSAVVQQKVTEALEMGLDPGEILNAGMIDAMTEVGRRFECGEAFVPEMLLAARAMQSGLVILKPYLVKTDYKSTGKVVIGTVKGDLHDIGKNLVSMMLEGAGFEIIDLGTDVSPQKIISTVQESAPDIVALSALLSTTMPNMKATIDGLAAAGLRQRVKVMIGGAPVTEAYAQQIGADGYSPNAARAIRVAKGLVGKS